MKKDLEKKIEEISKSCLGDESLAEVEMEVEKSIVGDCPICNGCSPLSKRKNDIWRGVRAFYGQYVATNINQLISNIA